MARKGKTKKKQARFKANMGIYPLGNFMIKSGLFEFDIWKFPPFCEQL